MIGAICRVQPIDKGTPELEQTAARMVGRFRAQRSVVEPASELLALLRELLRGRRLQLLELARQIREGCFDAHALQGTRAHETNGIGVLNDLLRIVGGIDWTAVAKEENVLP